MTGLRPKLPSALLAKFPVLETTVDADAKGLIDFLRSTYARVKALMQDAEQEAEGSMSQELHVGDLVLRRLSPHQQAAVAGAGPNWFTRAVDPRISG